MDDNATIAVQALQRSPFDVGEVVQGAWTLFSRDPAPYILGAVIYVGVTILTCGLASFVFGVLTAGYTVMGLKRLRGETPVVQDAFAGFQMFGQLFLLWLVMMFSIMIGFVLCILPGLYLMLAFSLATPLVVDRRMGFWEALKTSVGVFNQNLGPMLLVTLLLYLIQVLGSSIPLGFLVAQPLYFLGATVLYTRIFGLGPGASHV